MNNRNTTRRSLLKLSALSVGGFGARRLLGDESVWSVKDGILTGQTTAEKPIKHSSYLFSDLEASDFELTFKYRIVGGNSGMQYRSQRRGEWDVKGYQADMQAGPSGATYTGALYESAGRGIMVLRGESANDQFGWVSSAGDFNGDGKGDVIVGAGREGIVPGSAYIFFGGVTGIINAADADVIQGRATTRAALSGGS